MGPLEADGGCNVPKSGELCPDEWYGPETSAAWAQSGPQVGATCVDDLRAALGMRP